MRKVAKVLAGTAGGIAGLAVILYLVLLLINWRDQPPSPTALRFEAAYRDRPFVEDSKNAYVFILGFDARPSDDPYAMGVKRKQWFVESLTSGHFQGKDDPLSEAAYYTPKRDVAIEDFSKTCREKLNACADLMQAKQDVVAHWLQSEAWLRRRYVDLLSRPDWFEVVPFDIEAPLPSYGKVLDGQLLLLADARLLVSQGKIKAAQDLLASDVRFWRVVLTSSDILISKMIATAALTRHFEIVQGIARQAPPHDIERLIPKEWREPLTALELSMQRVMVGEYMFSAQLARNPEQWDAASGENWPEGMFSGFSQILVRPFYQVQDMINAHAEFLDSLAFAFVTPLKNYPKVLSAENLKTSSTFDRLFTLRAAYNPVGKVLNAIDQSSYAPYVVRVSDVEGVRRLALVTLLLRSSGIAPQDIDAALAVPEFRNPYTQRPFFWEAEQETILFEGLAEGKARFHRLKY